MIGTPTTTRRTIKEIDPKAILGVVAAITSTSASSASRASSAFSLTIDCLTSAQALAGKSVIRRQKQRMLIRFLHPTMNFEIDALADFCEFQEERNIFLKYNFGDTFFPKKTFKC
jgi:hypothetical protein